MTNVYLYGELRNKFGSEFKFKINSPKEAFLAINANRRGFLNEIKRLASKHIHYRIIIDDCIVSSPKEIEIKKIPKEIHIVPIVWGSGTGMEVIWFLEAVFASIGIYGSVGTFLAYTVAITAATLAVQGVMSLLYPEAKPDFNQEVQAGSKSYLFGNRPNNTAQGQAVPVGYGRLKIGGSQISAGMSHHPLNMDIKQLMTPTDKPINDYTSLEFENESPDSSDGLFQSSFSTNQSSQIEEGVSFASATIVNSYIDIVSKNAYKVTSSPVEVVVKRDGEVVSNVDLDTYDEDIEYEWSVIGSQASQAGQNNTETPRIKIEKPYAFENGLVFRTYHPKDFQLKTNYQNIPSTDSSYFVP
jgi:predicted phage tail protein